MTGKRVGTAALRTWIAVGMLALGCGYTRCAEPAAAESGIEESPITDEDRDHWSFRPIAEAGLPEVRQAEWAITAIDYFVLARLEQVGLSPAEPADRVTLLRRLKLDLLGLPPTPQEVCDFLADHRADAYERVVERWLASPGFGERWAQHWLDLARFAETDGFEHDKVRDAAWQYRDWVIEALNSDLPYDQFIALQIAGDLTGEPQHKIATLFCLASADMPDINEQDVRRHDRLNELTSTVGSALLGLQMHCAQCHDHKYDPISQADFYRLRAIFEPAVPALQRDQPFNVFSGDSPHSEPRLYVRGELRTPGPSVVPGFPRIAMPPHDDRRCDPQRPRQALAAWLFAADNPLTARVIVNRLWQHHFGRGLFENPSDVGVVAGEPSHPELLDWLAAALRQHGWSLKALHREMVLSATYRQASRRLAQEAVPDPAWNKRLQLDPRNQLYSRFPRYRLEGEAVRDCMLSMAGLLNRQAGGQSVMPPLPAELRGTLLKGQWQASPLVADHHRRSIYVFARRNLRLPIFDVFDRPDAGASCPQRSRSTTAIQSLQMLNSELSLKCANGLSERITASLAGGAAAQPEEWIQQLFRLALARSATETECAALLPFMQTAASRTAACLALLNTSELLYVD